MADGSVKQSTMVDSSSKNKNKKWIQKYKAEYSQLFNFARKSSKSDEHAFCTVCTVDFMPSRFLPFLGAWSSVLSLFQVGISA